MSARRRSTTGMSIKTMWATILSNRRLGQQRRAAVDAGDPGAGQAHLLGQPAVPAPKIKDLKPLHGPQPAPQEPVSAPVKAVGPARIGGGGSVPQLKILHAVRHPKSVAATAAPVNSSRSGDRAAASANLSPSRRR